MAEKLCCEELENKITELSKFKAISDKAGYGIVIVDLEGNVSYVNTPFAGMHGYTPDELIGKHLSIFHAEQQMAKVNRLIEQLNREGSYVSEEVWHKRKDKTEFPASMNGALIKDENGTPLFMAGTAIDITDRKQAEEALWESEEQHRTLVEAAPDVIYTISREDGSITSLNPAFERFTGWSRAEWLGKPFIDIVHPDDRAVAVETFEKCYRGETQLPYELRILSKSGECRVGEFTSTPHIKSGKIVGELGIVRDITERKKMEEQLKLSESRYRDLFENSGTSIMIVDRHGKYLLVNRAAAKVIGRLQDEITGKSMFDLLPEATAKKYLEANSRLIQSGGCREYEDAFISQDGEKVFRIVDRCLRDAIGRNFAIQSSAIDITDRVMAERQREVLQSELSHAQKLESLGTLIAGIAHEINNPINTIMNNAPLLLRIWKDMQPMLEERSKVDPSRRYGGLTYEFLRANLELLISDIDMSANRVAVITRGLKDFSQKTIFSEKERININTVVENAVRLAGSSLHKSGIVLMIDLEPGLPAIMANQQNLEQIIVNLVINAIQAIDHDYGKVKITTGYKKKAGVIVISIEDNGKGIDPAVSDKIFDPFFTGRQKEGGTGLGLAITHNLVKANNGSISFDTQKGKGTIFSVSFPTRPRIEPARILMVDDDEGILKVMEKALKRDNDYVVEKANNGNDALIKIGSFHPDLLLLDVLMPEMDGIEVVRAIKTQPELDRMKIIVVTGYVDHEKIKKISEMGIYKVLSKPIVMKDLLEEVEEAVKER